jgi:hypothetical protein
MRTASAAAHLEGLGGLKAVVLDLVQQWRRMSCTSDVPRYVTLRTT